MMELAPGGNELFATEASPWVDVADGIWFKLVKVLDNDSGWISLLRLKAGAAVGPHRHTGAGHGFCSGADMTPASVHSVIPPIVRRSRGPSSPPAL